MIALPRIIVKRWRDAGVDILVNNAGMGRNDAGLFDGNTASWVEMVSTNTLGVCMCTREAVQVKPSWFCKACCNSQNISQNKAAWCDKIVSHTSCTPCQNVALAFKPCCNGQSKSAWCDRAGLTRS